MLPIVRGWARTRGFAPSKFLIPLSFSTMSGGLLSVIGTSTNLVVQVTPTKRLRLTLKPIQAHSRRTQQGLLKDDGKEEFGFFDPGMVALPVGILAIIYLTTIGQKLLPDN